LSYTRSAEAAQSGVLAKEIVAVSVPSGKKGKPDTIIEQDEEFSRWVGR